jgi:hypothetical protein
MALQVASAGLLGLAVQTLSSTALADIQTVIVNLQNALTGSGEKADKLLQKLKYKSSNPEGIQGLVKEINMAISEAVPANASADLNPCFDAGKPNISDLVQKAGENLLGPPHRADMRSVSEVSEMHAVSIFRVELNRVRNHSCMLYALLLYVCIFTFWSTRSTKGRSRGKILILVQWWQCTAK